MPRLTPSQEVALIAARIDRRKASHQSTAADERDLIRAKAKQLRSELRANRKRAA